MNQTVRLLNPGLDKSPNDLVARVAYVDDFLSARECEKVLDSAKKQIVTPGKTGNLGKTDSARESQVRFLWPGGEVDWLFEKLETALLELNDAYGFELSGFYEGAQVASYTAGGHYDWHSDLGSGNQSNRKLSMSVQLSPAEDYAGGELEFMTATDELSPKNVGALIVFPSFITHRVRPITRGLRHSLVSWISGPSFR